MTDLGWTYDTYRQALERSGVGKEAAMREANAKFGSFAIQEPRQATNGARVVADYVRVVGPFLAFPIRLTVPWTGLCSDNAKYTLNSQRRITLTREYREAKLKARELGRGAMTAEATTFPPMERPLRVEVQVWVPDERPHDCANFLKCLLDGLEKAVYVNDRWLYDTRIVRAGVDPDRPRAEITVQPL